jgi:hypothetical protein
LRSSAFLQEKGTSTSARQTEPCNDWSHRSHARPVTNLGCRSSQVQILSPRPSKAPESGCSGSGASSWGWVGAGGLEELNNPTSVAFQANRRAGPRVRRRRRASAARR